eukprot:31089-Pelagococcus_subviridis.AAC.14
MKCRSVTAVESASHARFARPPFGRNPKTLYAAAGPKKNSAKSVRTGNQMCAVSSTKRNSYGRPPRTRSVRPSDSSTPRSGPLLTASLTNAAESLRRDPNGNPTSLAADILTAARGSVARIGRSDPRVLRLGRAEKEKKSSARIRHVSLSRGGGDARARTI